MSLVFRISGPLHFFQVAWSHTSAIFIHYPYNYPQPHLGHIQSSIILEGEFLCVSKNAGRGISRFAADECGVYIDLEPFLTMNGSRIVSAWLMLLVGVGLIHPFSSQPTEEGGPPSDDGSCGKGCDAPSPPSVTCADGLVSFKGLRVPRCLDSQVHSLLEFELPPIEPTLLCSFFFFVSPGLISCRVWLPR
jgi:hypothetical protein